MGLQCPGRYSLVYCTAVQNTVENESKVFSGTENLIQEPGEIFPSIYKFYRPYTTACRTLGQKPRIIFLKGWIVT